MKIYIAAYQPGRTGGGWTFTDNLVKAFSRPADMNGFVITSDYAEADVYFIPSPSMVQRDEVRKAKDDGKKIVLRIDNAVRNSRNRNTGMSRMKDFAEWADLVIYQSNWARDYLVPFTGVDGPVILNGVDLDAYHDAHDGLNSENNILYSRFNRDETKNWEAARYWYSQYQIQHPDAKLHIVGQFSDDLRAGNFDFYNGENYEFYGVLDQRALAKLYGISSLLYTYFNDACSNTLIEALASGSPLVGDAYYRKTGGSAQIIRAFQDNGREYLSLDRMGLDYKNVMESSL